MTVQKTTPGNVATYQKLTAEKSINNHEGDNGGICIHGDMVMFAPWLNG